jgi:ParB-like chromosome segregation protein Spo0J
MEQSNMELISIKKIKSNPNNPRLIKDDKFAKLVTSIKEFPEMLEIRPIVVNKDMIVLGGNMRLKACIEAGLKEVPVSIVDLTEDQQKAFIIKDNVSGGEWDWNMLANEWDAEELTEWGLDIPNFKIEEPIDLSSEIKNLYKIEIDCIDEETQENTYNKLIEQGYECRLLTL